MRTRNGNRSVTLFDGNKNNKKILKDENIFWKAQVISLYLYFIFRSRISLQFHSFLALFRLFKDLLMMFFVYERSVDS